MQSQLKQTDGIVEKLTLQGNTSGKLRGKTFVVKDLFDVKGGATGGGNPDWQAGHAPATKHAAAVTLMLDAGATLVGISCSDEFAFSLDGINIHYGVPRNPQYEDRVSGGSSSGSASAVGNSLVDFALGTDTAGSVRIPSSYCGIYGLRPTLGRISTEGVLPLSQSLDTVGCFARTPELLRLCESVMLQTVPTEKLPKKLIIATDAFELMDDTISDGLRSALETLQKSFAVVEELQLSSLDWASYPEHLHNIRAWEAIQFYGPWFDAHNPRMAPFIKSRFDACRSATKELHDSSLAFAAELQAKFNTLLQDVVLCFPTSCGLPPLIDADADEIQANRVRNIKLTSTSSIAGLPEISVPIDIGNGRKSGLSFATAANGDEMLLNLACHLSELVQSKPSSQA